MIIKIEELKDFISSEEKGITKKNTRSITKKEKTKTYKTNSYSSKKCFKKCVKAVW